MYWGRVSYSGLDLYMLGADLLAECGNTSVGVVSPYSGHDILMLSAYLGDMNHCITQVGVINAWEVYLYQRINIPSLLAKLDKRKALYLPLLSLFNSGEMICWVDFI